MRNFNFKISDFGFLFIAVGCLVGCGKSKFSSDAKTRPTQVQAPPVVSTENQQPKPELKEDPKLKGIRPKNVSVTLVLDTGANVANHFSVRRNQLPLFVERIQKDFPNSALGAISFDDTVLKTEPSVYGAGRTNLLTTILKENVPWFKGQIGSMIAGASINFDDKALNFGFGALQTLGSSISFETDTKHIVFYQSNAVARDGEFNYDTWKTAQFFSSTVADLRSKNQDLVIVWGVSAVRTASTDASYPTPRDQFLEMLNKAKIQNLEIGYDFSKMESLFENNGSLLYNRF